MYKKDKRCKYNWNTKYVIVGLCFAITLIMLTLLNIPQDNKGKIVINGINITKMWEKDKIGVYIDGEVNNPGYIQISKGKTLEYALNKIGGITREADINSINLKQILKNGEKIYIPTKRTYLDETEIEKESSEKVNINTANKEELKTLEGIGDKTAESIIEYRENNRFSSIEEIIEVKGIGEWKYENIKDDICV